MFLLLYGLFQGSIGVRNGVSTEPFGVSFATLLLGLMCSGLQQDSILSSILHTLARVHALGPFMPEWQDLRPSSQRRNDRFFGMPTNDEVESSLGRLLGTVLVEMRSLTGTPRAIREVTRKMVNRRSEVLTKELMYGGGTDSVDAGWGGWGGGGGISFGGGTFGPKRAMEDVAEEADQQIELEVSQLAQLRVLKKTGTAKPADCTPAVDERVPGNELEGCELTQVLLSAEPETTPRISDFSCDARTLHASSPLEIASLGAEKLHHFSRMPLKTIGLDDGYALEVPRACLGLTPVGSQMRFDVSLHPDARSKVAVDMKRRLVKTSSSMRSSTMSRVSSTAALSSTPR